MKKRLANFANRILGAMNLELRKLDGAMAVQQRLLPNAQTIFDVGANVGTTIKEYNHYFPQAMLYGFEPFPETFQKLTENTQQNPKAKIFKQGIADHNGIAAFYSNAMSDTNSLLPSEKTNSFIDVHTETKQVIEIETVTIDSFMTKHQISSIDILKMDIQGGELLALQGAAQALRQEQIKLIYTEVSFIEIYKGQPLFHHLTNYLEPFGYQLFGMYKPYSKENGQMAWADAIYISKSLIR